MKGKEKRKKQKRKRNKKKQRILCMFSHLYFFFEGKREGRWREGKKRERGKVSWGSGKKREGRKEGGEGKMLS